MSAFFQQIRAFRRDVRLFLITPALIGFTVFGGIYTVLFNLYLVRMAYGTEFIGLVNAISQFALAIFALPATFVGAKLGTRRAMILGLTLAMVGHGLPVLAEFIPGAARQTWILATYLLGGLGLALYFVNSAPWVMAVATPQERSHVFSVQAALWPLAGFVGSLVGGMLPALFARALHLSLDSPIPYRYPLLLAAALLVIAVLAMLRTTGGELPVASSGGTTTRAHDPLPLAILGVIALVGILRGSGEGVARTFFNIYMDTELGASAARIGGFLAIGQLISVPAALLTPLFAARWGHERAIVWGTFGLALALLPFALIPHWAAAGFSFMAMLVVISIARPAFMVYTQEIVARHWQGTMSAITTMAIGISWAAMAFGGGYLITSVGYRALFLIGAGLTAIGAALFQSYFSRPRGLPVPSNESVKPM